MARPELLFRGGRVVDPAGGRDEIADVLLYLIRLADQLDIDPVAEAHRKLAANEKKYPADKARGNAKKYTEL